MADAKPSPRVGAPATRGSGDSPAEFTWLVRLIATYVFGLAVVAIFAFAAESYFNVPVTTVLSWHGSDVPIGLTAPSNYAVGQHYFGDFLTPYLWGSAGNPWTGNVVGPDNYLPVTNLLFKVFAIFPYRIALWSYLTLSALAVVAPFAFMIRGYRLGVVVIITVLLCVLTYPFLINLDRGNSQVILVPLFVGVATTMAQHRWRWAAGFIVAAALLKGYPIFLLLLLVPYRQWRVCIEAIVAFALANVVAVAVFPGDFFTTFNAVISALHSFTATTELGLIAVNDSVTGCLLNLVTLLGHGSGQDAAWLTTHPWIPGIVYLVAVTPLIVARRIPLWARLLVAFSTTQMVVPVSHGYTTVYMVVIAAIFAQSALKEAPAVLLARGRSATTREPRDTPEPLHLDGPPLLIWTGLVAIVATLLPAPWSTTGHWSSLATIYGPLAIIAFVCACYAYLYRSWRPVRA